MQLLAGIHGQSLDLQRDNAPQLVFASTWSVETGERIHRDATAKSCCERLPAGVFQLYGNEEHNKYLYIGDEYIKKQCLTDAVDAQTRCLSRAGQVTYLPRALRLRWRQKNVLLAPSLQDAPSPPLFVLTTVVLCWTDLEDTY